MFESSYEMSWHLGRLSRVEKRRYGTSLAVDNGGQRRTGTHDLQPPLRHAESGRAGAGARISDVEHRYFALARELSFEFDIYLLDFPGHGLSDKPPEPYVYSFVPRRASARRRDHPGWQLTEFRMLTHDRGSSVGMIAVGMLAAQDPAAAPVDLILTNGNIYLPLSNLTAFQTALLDPATARATAAATTPEMLAAGMGMTTFMPRRTLQDPEIAALAQCFAHNDGIRVLPESFNT